MSDIKTEPIPADCLPPPELIDQLLRGPDLDAQGRIVGGLFEGLAPDEVLMQREAYRRACWG